MSEQAEPITEENANTRIFISIECGGFSTKGRYRIFQVRRLVDLFIQWALEDEAKYPPQDFQI